MLLLKDDLPAIHGVKGADVYPAKPNQALVAHTSQSAEIILRFEMLQVLFSRKIPLLKVLAHLLTLFVATQKKTVD